MKVLIAEDEHLILEELTNMIPWQSMGLELIGQATDGLSALALLRKQQVDIFITDIRMPGRDGLSVIEEIKPLYDIDCIIISGYQEFDYALRAIRLGVVDYLLKPVNEEALLKILRRIIENKKAAHGEKEEQDSGASTRDIQNKYVHDILEYIDQNYMNNITIHSLAEHLFISEGYVSRIFYRFMHKHLPEYLNEFRIMKAMRLLKTSNRKIYEIAAMVGYNDYRYFCIVFKNVTGKTPVEYKNSYC